MIIDKILLDKRFIDMINTLTYDYIFLKPLAETKHLGYSTFAAALGAKKDIYAVKRYIYVFYRAYILYT